MESRSRPITSIEEILASSVWASERAWSVRSLSFFFSSSISAMILDSSRVEVAMAEPMPITGVVVAAASSTTAVLFLDFDFLAAALEAAAAATAAAAVTAALSAAIFSSSFAIASTASWTPATSSAASPITSAIMSWNSSISLLERSTSSFAALARFSSPFVEGAGVSFVFAVAVALVFATTASVFGFSFCLNSFENEAGKSPRYSSRRPL
mmetsp:Transcript_10196/g.21387  ORF Transcript_10196/g.21387 Transcript_10196/m.21387 type:complete len:211 (-) Transcript_10196:774-1406(-)